MRIPLLSRGKPAGSQTPARQPAVQQQARTYEVDYGNGYANGQGDHGYGDAFDPYAELKAVTVSGADGWLTCHGVKKT